MSVMVNSYIRQISLLKTKSLSTIIINFFISAVISVLPPLGLEWKGVSQGVFSYNISHRKFLAESSYVTFLIVLIQSK